MPSQTLLRDGIRKSARAELILRRKALQSKALTRRWLTRLNAFGRLFCERNGDGNADVGVIGIVPEPTLGIPKYSAAEKAAKATRPEATTKSQPSATSM